MAPTSSDGPTTDLADPDTPANDTDAADATDTPFGDWREQLRDRVKEIRARKHAVHREDVDDIALNATAATTEKVEMARAKSADVGESRVQLVDGAPDARRSDIASLVDDLIGGPPLDPIEPASPALAEPVDLTPETPELPEPVLPAAEVHAAELNAAELAEPEDAETLVEEPVPAAPELPGPELASPALVESEMPGLDMPAPLLAEPVMPKLESAPEPIATAEITPEPVDVSDAPLFQDELEVFANDPIREIEDEFTTLEPAAEDTEVPAADRLLGTEPEPALHLEANDVAEAVAPVDDLVVEEAVLAADAEPEVAEIDVPTWAINSDSKFAPEPIALDEPDGTDDGEGAAGDPLLDAIPPELRDVDIPSWALPREPGRIPEATSEAPADAHLVGDFTTPTSDKRTDLGPPPETSIPTADLLDRAIGDLSALNEEEVEIAPPGSLVDASDFGRGKSADDSRPLPGLFDTTDELEDTATEIESVADDLETGADLEVAEASDDLSAAATAAVDELALGKNETAADALAEPVADPATNALAEDVLARIRETPPVMPEAVAEQATPRLSPEPELDATPDSITPTASAAVDAPATPFFDEPAKSPAALSFEAVLDELDTAEADQALDSDAFDGLASDNAEGATSTENALEWDVDGGLDAEAAAAVRDQQAEASAPISDRVYSALADGLVMGTIGLVLMIAGASAAGRPVIAFVQAAPIPFLLVWAIFGVVYGVIFVGTCGQTLGKMAMRVRVIGADNFHVGYGRAALRALAYGAAALPAGLGLLPAFSDPEHRGLHDRVTSTRVVKA